MRVLVYWGLVDCIGLDLHGRALLFVVLHNRTTAETEQVSLLSWLTNFTQVWKLKPENGRSVGICMCVFRSIRAKLCTLKVGICEEVVQMKGIVINRWENFRQNRRREVNKLCCPHCHFEDTNMIFLTEVWDLKKNLFSADWYWRWELKRFQGRCVFP